MKIKVLITCYNGNFKKIIDYLDKSKFEIVLYNKKNIITNKNYSKVYH